MGSSTKLVVITGTSIDVGKSTLTKALSRRLISGGASVVAIKPVEVWCDRGLPGSEDGEALARITGQKAPLASLVRLRPSAVPPLAADIEGVEIKWDSLIDEIKSHAEGHDVALVESVGGACTPITWEHDYLDLAKALDAPLMLVGRDHIQGAAATLMAMRAVKGAGLKVISVAMNVTSEADHTTGTNAVVVRKFSGFERVTTVRNVRDAGGYHEIIDAASKLDSIGQLATWILEQDGSDPLPGREL